MKDRSYTEKEIAALLERAAELQADVARRSEHQPTLTLAELEVVASEAGLDPVLLRQAAAELEAPGYPVLGENVGATATHNLVERWVPGDLTSEAMEDLVAELRHRFDTDAGKAMGMPTYGSSTTEQIGRSLEWRHTSMSGIETRVLLRPRGGRVHVRLSQRVGWAGPQAESVSYGMLLSALMALLAGGVLNSVFIAITTLVLAAAALVPLIYVLDQKWRRKKHRALQALGDDIAGLLAASARERPGEKAGDQSPEAAPEAAPEATARLLENDPEAEAPAEAQAAPRVRTRG